MNRVHTDRIKNQLEIPVQIGWNKSLIILSWVDEIHLTLILQYRIDRLCQNMIKYDEKVGKLVYHLSPSGTDGEKRTATNRRASSSELSGFQPVFLLFAKKRFFSCSTSNIKPPQYDSINYFFWCKRITPYFLGCNF